MTFCVPWAVYYDGTWDMAWDASRSSISIDSSRVGCQRASGERYCSEQTLWQTSLTGKIEKKKKTGVRPE
jgi:hypothetical protein